MKREGIRLWVGQQKNGIVDSNEWIGAEPLWNIGIWVRSRDVQQGLKISEITNVIKNTLETRFSSYHLEISPKAKEALKGTYDNLN